MDTYQFLNRGAVAAGRDLSIPQAMLDGESKESRDLRFSRSDWEGTSTNRHLLGTDAGPGDGGSLVG